MIPSAPEALEIRKSNRLIDGRYRLHIHALRVLVLATSKLAPTQGHDHIVSFSAQEYAHLIKCPSHHLYEELRNAARELMGAVMSIPTDDFRQKKGSRRVWTDVFPVVAAQLDAGTGVFWLEFHQTMIGYTYGVAPHTCRYDLRDPMQLTSRHAFRFFELVKSWAGYVDESGRHKPFVMQIEDLRRMLGVEEAEYQKYSHFRTRILEASANQLAEHTQLSFKYRPIRSSRTVTALRLTVVSKSSSGSEVPETASAARAHFAEFKNALSGKKERANQNSEVLGAPQPAGRTEPADPLAAAQAKQKFLHTKYDRLRVSAPHDAAAYDTLLAEIKEAGTTCKKLLLERFGGKTP